jgi:hypothetical protein
MARAPVSKFGCGCLSRSVLYRPVLSFQGNLALPS